MGQPNAILNKLKLVWWAIGLTVSILLFNVTAASILAQTTAYTITRWSFSSAGASSGNNYTLSAITGQSEVAAPMIGGAYTLVGGWRPASVTVDVFGPCREDKPCVFLPLVAGGQ